MLVKTSRRSPGSRQHLVMTILQASDMTELDMYLWSVRQHQLKQQFIDTTPTHRAARTVLHQIHHTAPSRKFHRISDSSDELHDRTLLLIDNSRSLCRISRVGPGIALHSEDREEIRALGDSWCTGSLVPGYAMNNEHSVSVTHIACWIVDQTSCA